MQTFLNLTGAATNTMISATPGPTASGNAGPAVDPRELVSLPILTLQVVTTVPVVVLTIVKIFSLGTSAGTLSIIIPALLCLVPLTAAAYGFMVIPRGPTLRLVWNYDQLCLFAAVVLISGIAYSIGFEKKVAEYDDLPEWSPDKLKLVKLLRFVFPVVLVIACVPVIAAVIHNNRRGNLRAMVHGQGLAGAQQQLTTTQQAQPVTNQAATPQSLYPSLIAGTGAAPQDPYATNFGPPPAY